MSRKAICRGLVLFVVAQMCWVSCGTPGIRLCGSTQSTKSGIARIRSGPKAVIVAIDSCNVDDMAVKRTDPNSMRCDPGRWNEVSVGSHRIKVMYHGFYRHINPPYRYIIRGETRNIQLEHTKSSTEAIDMISDSAVVITVDLEAGKKYELHVELDYDKRRTDYLPNLPPLVAPRNPNVVIVDFGYIVLNDGWVGADSKSTENDPLLVPRASELVVTGFPWRAYVEEVGAKQLADDSVTSTPIQKAINSGNVEFVRLLLNTGENIKAKTASGMTLLHLAAQSGHTDVVRVFLDEGIDVNSRNEAGCTPLFYAAGEGHRSIVNLLLLHGAKVHLAQQDGWTPLHHAALGGHLEVVKILVEKGAKVNAFNRMDMTPLFLAADQGYESVVKFLLEKGALVNIHQVDGFTPLHYAALDGHVSICKMLLEAGAEVNAVSKTGMTPLHDACLGGHVDVARLLLMNKADVNAVTRDGWTVMHMAAYSGNIGLVGLLKEYGYKTDANAKSEISPKEVAKAKGNMLFRIAIEGKK